MKLSHVTETTPDEAADRVTQYLKSRKHLNAEPASIQHNSGNNEWHREQDRLEQSQNDERATANEDMSDTPNPGDNIRTNRTDMEGKVERVDQNVVFFRLADGRLMKTSTNNVTVVEKLADEEGEIMEKKDSLNLSNKITDPGLLADIEFANSHYPGSSNGLEALLKLFSRGHHHSEKNDKVHDEQLAKIQHDMDAVKRVASEHPQLREVDKKYGAEIEQLKQEIIALKRGSIEQQRVSQGGTGRRVADMQSIEESELREISDTVINKWQREKLGPQMDAAKARGDTEEEDRVYGKIIKSTKHMGDNFERRAAQKAEQEKEGVTEGSTTRGGFSGSASQAQHEIQWTKNKIETLKPLLAKRPSVARQIKDLERQIRERELAIAYQKEGVTEDQLNELDRQTVINYVPARINSAKALARTDYNKSKRITQKDIPRALTKLRDKNYGRAKKGDVEENEEINNPTDTVTVDIPLLIRIMEYAKEDAKTDLDLHNAAEKLIALSHEGRTLTMDDYDTMIGDVKEGGMGGLNRCAPSNDVSYQDVLDNSTDEWRGDTVKVEESTFYSERLKAFLKDID